MHNLTFTSVELEKPLLDHLIKLFRCSWNLWLSISELMTFQIFTSSTVSSQVIFTGLQPGELFSINCRPSYHDDDDYYYHYYMRLFHENISWSCTFRLHHVPLVLFSSRVLRSNLQQWWSPCPCRSLAATLCTLFKPSFPSVVSGSLANKRVRIFFKWVDHAWIQYTIPGLMCFLYNMSRKSLWSLLTFLFTVPIIGLALSADPPNCVLVLKSSARCTSESFSPVICSIIRLFQYNHSKGKLCLWSTCITLHLLELSLRSHF